MVTIFEKSLLKLENNVNFPTNLRSDGTLPPAPKFLSAKMHVTSFEKQMK